MKQLAQEEKAEVERMKRDLSLKRRAATEQDKKRIETARAARAAEYARRRTAATAAVKDVQKELQTCAKTQLTKTQELEKTVQARIEAQKAAETADNVGWMDTPTMADVTPLFLNDVPFAVHSGWRGSSPIARPRRSRCWRRPGG